MNVQARYRAVLGITLATFLIEVAGSLNTNSNGLLSDALHLLGDGIPFVLGWVCVRFILYEDVEANLETLIGYFNAIALGAMAVYIGVAGVIRIYHPVDVDKAMLIFAIFGVIGNFAQLYFAWGLRHAHQHSSTFFGQILHLAMDVLSSISVLGAAYLVWATGNSRIDTYASLIVAAITAWAGWHCFRDVHFPHEHTHDEHAHAGHSHH